MRDPATHIGHTIGGTNQLNNIHNNDSNKLAQESSVHMPGYSMALAKHVIKFLTNVNQSQKSQGGGEEGAKYGRDSKKAVSTAKHYQSLHKDPVIILTRAVEGIVEILNDEGTSAEEKEEAMDDLDEIIGGLFGKSSKSTSGLFGLARNVGQSLGGVAKSAIGKLFR